MRKFKPAIYSIIIGFALGTLILVLTGNGPFILVSKFFQATVLDITNTGNWLMQSSILMLTGLSIALAYRGGSFNIGAEGQFLVGSFASSIVAIIPMNIGWSQAILALIVGIVSGGLYALIPGYLKAYHRVSEVVVSIMLNWIALKYIGYLVQSNDKIHGNIVTQTQTFQEGAKIHSNFLSDLFAGATMHWGFVLVLISIFGYWFIFDKTTFGYEIKAVGYNKDAAKYAGIKDKKIIMNTFFISGALSGAAGAIYSLGTTNYFTALGVFQNYGFDGITVAFLGSMNAIGMTVSALLIGGLRNAGLLMSEVPKEIIDIIIAIILVAIVIANKKASRRG